MQLHHVHRCCLLHSSANRRPRLRAIPPQCRCKALANVHGSVHNRFTEVFRQWRSQTSLSISHAYPVTESDDKAHVVRYLLLQDDVRQSPYSYLVIPPVSGRHGGHLTR